MFGCQLSGYCLKVLVQSSPVACPPLLCPPLLSLSSPLLVSPCCQCPVTFLSVALLSPTDGLPSKEQPVELLKPSGLNHIPSGACPLPLLLRHGVVSRHSGDDVHGQGLLAVPKIRNSNLIHATCSPKVKGDLFSVPEWNAEDLLKSMKSLAKAAATSVVREFECSRKFNSDGAEAKVQQLINSVARQKSGCFSGSKSFKPPPIMHSKRIM
ncbi:hypothetical protein P4O66_002528 [Electrophorus voltai]|uniref:Uncharacterized protein n=1 Tax=Electrophorus voltai TaxID=2609070 RepID=A0AAD8YZE5_9TELE|nr:hypothetical protein P4O66_002528 [Electrophorus voltai]